MKVGKGKQGESSDRSLTLPKLLDAIRSMDTILPHVSEWALVLSVYTLTTQTYPWPVVRVIRKTASFFVPNSSIRVSE